MSIGISYSSISMHLIVVFLIKIARKITAFNKICTHHQYFFLYIVKFCHFLKKSAIWDSAKWNRQYGIRQSGIRLKIINDLADKISVSAYIWCKFPPCTLAMRRTLISLCLIISSLNALDDLCIWMALFSCMYECIGHGEDAGFAMYNVPDFAQILYFVGGVRIINRNNVFHSFPDWEITCLPCFFVYYCQHAKLDISSYENTNKTQYI